MFKNLLIIAFGILLTMSASFASDTDKISQKQGNSVWQRILNGNNSRYHNNNRNYNNNDRSFYGRDNYRNSDRNNNNNNRRNNRRNRNY